VVFVVFCVKFHKNPISGLGGLALTRYMDGRTDGRTDGRMDGRTDMVIPIYPLSFVCGGYKNNKYQGGGMYLVSATPTKLLI
jgi:hypothetical protein